MADNNKLYEVALGNTPLVGSKTSKTLLAYCGSAKAIFSTTKGKLLKIPGVGEQIATSLLTKDNLIQAEKEIVSAEKRGDQLIFFTDKAYPTRLKEIHDAPSLLYVNGNTNLNASKTLAIVGTRNITSYGKRVCEKILADLADTDTLIISGLAYGVDINAHRFALENNLSTLGVMANGLDQIYPASHKGTALQMTQNGGLMTEEPYGTKPLAMRFPARNRIVSGLADAVIVVESADTGGSLITANLAFDYNKEVFAVPGELGEKYSVGCNNLIEANKAHIFTSVSRLFEEMSWDKSSSNQKVISLDLSSFQPEEQAILNLLQKEGEQAIDELTWKLQTSPNKLASTLLNLELTNIVDVMPGKKYKVKTL